MSRDGSVDENPRDLELWTMREQLKTRHGRAFLYRCLQNTGVFANIFDQDPISHAYNAGLRSHGLWLINELKEAESDLYYTMLKENENE